MCGIAGYAGHGQAAAIVFEGLTALEYRGYDSAGIAVMCGGKVRTVKCAGRVEKLRPRLCELEGKIGIGHTRWATHGRPTDVNAHPHTYGRVTIVHNGIIENYAEIKAELEERGEIFLSETDSEALAHLIDGFYAGDLVEAVAKCAEVVKGSYALLAMCDGGEEIVAAKARSPVIIGLGENCNFCASDMPALAGKCGKVCVLEDGDIARITAERVEIFDSEMRRTERVVMENTARAADLSTGGFPHYMLKELWEAPAALKNTISAFPDAEEGIEGVFSDADRIILAGCGTAYHAALAGKTYLREIAGIAAEAEYAGELRYAACVGAKRTAVIAVTQSGETADVVEAALKYKSLGAKVLAVTNSPYSRICRIADAVVPVFAGPEICVAATKSYSCQLAALYMIALKLAGDVRRAIGLKDIEKAPRLVLDALEDMDIYALAERCARSKGVYFLGRGIDYASALEGSLKLKEVSYLAGGGFAASELKHGTLALIDGSTLSIFLINDPALAAKSANAAFQTLARQGKIAVISSIPEVLSQFSGKGETVKLPPCDALISPIVAASALQSLAYRTAVLMGRDPDKPRNLAKSVTVE